MSENQLMFFSPGISKAELGDIFDKVAISNREIYGSARVEKSQLSCDPVTVALIGAASATVVALINAATQAYLEWKREKKGTNNCSVKVTIYNTLGSSCFIEVNDKNGIIKNLIQIPSDFNEIAKVKLE